MGIAILIEASLSFIGLGTQPPDPSLGGMLADGRSFMREAHWVVTFPGSGDHDRGARVQSARGRSARFDRAGAMMSGRGDKTTTERG